MSECVRLLSYRDFYRERGLIDPQSFTCMKQTFTVFTRHGKSMERRIGAWYVVKQDRMHRDYIGMSRTNTPLATSRIPPVAYSYTAPFAMSLCCYAFRLLTE